MKLKLKDLKKLINETMNYYDNYMDDHKYALENYGSYFVKGRKQNSPELQSLIDLTVEMKPQLEAEGIVNLERYIDVGEFGLPVDKLIIHRMLKGEIPIDFDYIRKKISAANRFASDMSSGRYGSLD